MPELNFQHNYSSQCHTILQKSFEYAYLLLNKPFLLLSMLKTGLLFNILGIFFFSVFFQKMNWKFQRTAFIWNRNHLYHKCYKHML